MSFNINLSQTIPKNKNIKKLQVKLTKDEQELYPLIYNMLDNNDLGSILGRLAANFMKRSNLPKDILKKIWLTAAQTYDSIILKDEFYVALRLIALAQNNMPFTAENIEINYPIPPLPNFDFYNININNLNENNNYKNQIQDKYEITDKEKTLFQIYFNNKKEPNIECITVHNAIIIWKKNNVDDNTISIIANLLKPLEKKGFLNLKEFQVACKLTIIIKKQFQLPQKLPDTLIKFLGRNNSNVVINRISGNNIIQKNGKDNNDSKERKIFLENQNEIMKKRIFELENIIKENEIKLNERENRNDVLNKKIIELENKLNNNYLNNRIVELEEEIKKYKTYFLSFDEELYSIKFISTDQVINFTLISKNKDNFSKIEDMLYKKYPQYKETENIFLLNGSRINRHKTLEENNIKNNDIITLTIIDYE